MITENKIAIGNADQILLVYTEIAKLAEKYQSQLAKCSNATFQNLLQTDAAAYSIFPSLFKLAVCIGETFRHQDSLRYFFNLENSLSPEQ